MTDKERKEAPSLGELLRRAMESRLLDVHTALPARIESYDAETQTAEVQPVVRRALRDRNDNKVTETLTPIPSVPVAFPQGGGFFVSFPLKKGDHVLLVFSQWDIAEWRRKGGIQDPGDLRKHHLSHAVAIPGVETRARALEGASDTNLVVGEDGGNRMEIEPGGPMHLGKQSAGEEALALAQKTKNELDAIKSAFDSHTHPVDHSTSTTAPSGPPGSPMPEPGSVAASSVKAD